MRVITKQAFKYVDSMMILDGLFHPILNLLIQFTISQMLILNEVLTIESPWLCFNAFKMPLKTLI
jgi:hypothetical protein